MAPLRKKKRKASGVGVDFKRVKHKVGRKLPPPANATKLEIKSKVIVVPGQSLAQEKDGIAVNSRRQTLRDLLMQTSHHNENVRKDALMGILDLLAQHPKELSLHAVAIIEKLSPRMTDSNKGVRQALLQLLRSTVFKGLPEAVMGPLVPMMMAYVSSAMTHLSLGIRITAFSFLDLLVQYYPSLVVTCKDQIIEYYVEFLRKVGVLGEYGSSLTHILNGLFQFLSALLRIPTKYMDQVACLSQDNDYASQASRNSALALHWYKSVLPNRNSISKASATTGDSNLQKEAVASLIRVLANCWAECAPSVFSGQTPDTVSLDCMVSISQALHLIFQCIAYQEASFFPCQKDRCARNMVSGFASPCLSSGATDSKWMQENVISVLSHHLVASFPIQAPSINFQYKVKERLVALNVGICEIIFDLFMMGGCHFDVNSRKINTLLGYVEGALYGRMLPSGELSSDVMDKRLFEYHANSLLHFIPKVLINVSEEWRLRLLQAMTSVFKSSKAASHTKLSCLSCISEMLLHGKGSNLIVDNDLSYIIPFEFQKEWLQTLPRILWELKHNHASQSLAVLQLIHHLGRSAPDCSHLAEEYTKLQETLIPFFSTFSTLKDNKGRLLYGPFIRLPVQCQLLAIDSLYYHKNFSSALLTAVARCCICSMIQVTVIVRCVEVLQKAFCRGSITLSDHISFLLTLVATTNVEENGDTKSLELKEAISKFQRHKTISGVVCSCLAQIGDGNVLLDLISPSLSQRLVLKVPLEVSYGMIKVIYMLGCTRTSFYLPDSLFTLLPEFVANHLLSTIEMACRSNGDTIKECSLQPCFALLSQTDKVSEMVISHLYSLSKEKQCATYERKKYVYLALLHVFDLERVQQKLFIEKMTDSLSQRLKVVKSIQFMKCLDNAQLEDLCKELHSTACQAYGWHKGLSE